MVKLQKKSKVLFLMLAYPDVAKDSNLYTDLAEEFAANNHEVTVVAPSFKNKTRLGEEGRLKVPNTVL